MSLPTSYRPTRAILIMSCLALAVLALALTGCGKSSDETGASASRPAPVAHTAASGPAVTGPVSFNELTLESKPQIVKDKHGLIFLKFRYADNDGKVYECLLPEAMSKGQYTLGEWLSTFNAYRIPKVVAQKKKPKTTENLSDYPFISPKPVQTTNPQQPGAGTSPNEVPPLPPGPAPTQPPSPYTPPSGSPTPPGGSATNPP